MLFSRKTPAHAGDITLSASNFLTQQSPHILDGTLAPSGYLAGQLLVATPLITESCFHKSVVYVFNHTADGAMGIIINQPLEMVHFTSLIESANLPADSAKKDIPVYLGGPVEKSRGFVVHTTDYNSEAQLAHHGDVAVTASSSILMDIVNGKGPHSAILAVGFAGWDAGQLEQEIADNSWINVPATASLIFNTPDDHKWGAASKSLGVDMNFYSTAIGHA